ncbi:sialate O-acetylesterase [Dyadobacter bucti]|uniref:sialate O-acetylesterase n=1 Tax=Dyadobacter bucti TaxID=2572203 RepID=UPI003F726096
MKVITLALSMLVFVGEAYAERIYSVVFSQIPKDFQLYARGDDNKAEVPVEGVIEVTGWNHMSVVVYRNKVRVGYIKAVLQYTGNTASFSMKPTITAEMADYDFEIYACKTDDSTQLAKRTEIVAGDFYVISGQSNAAAVHFGSWSSKYARTIARTPDNEPNIGAGDTLWIQSSWSWPYAGAWGVEMQRDILENHGIPTCVINGALPGSYISYHTERNAANPGAPSLYGYLYSRIKVSKASRIRAFIWYQGEQEALENIRTYQQEYDKLFNYWQTDYPMVDKFVVVQIPVLFNPFYYAGTLREFQRKTKYTYPKTDHFNVMGLPYFDGIHYDIKGYQQLGHRFFRYFEPDIYGAADDINVQCPDMKKVFYSSDKKDEITIQYEQGQNMVWPADTLIDDVNGNKFLKGLKDVYFFDGDETKPANIQSGTAQGNLVKLKLTAASTAKKLNYLPAYKGEQIRIYYGPFLKNTKGLGAFSFQEAAIADLLVFSKFEAAESSMATVNVTWTSTGAETFILQRKVDGAADFVNVEGFDGKASSFEDKNVVPNTTYTYRIQAFSAASESVLMTTAVKTSPLLANEPNNQDILWKVYPNPVTEQIRVEFKNATSGQLQLLSPTGQSLQSAQLVSKKYYQINATTLPSGIYILSLTKSDGVTISRKVIKK